MPAAASQMETIGLRIAVQRRRRRRRSGSTSLMLNYNGGVLCVIVKSLFLLSEGIFSLECARYTAARFNSGNYASLRAVSGAEGHAEAGNRGGAEAHGGDLDGARRRGQKSREPRREKTAVQDQETQPAAHARCLLPGRLSRLTVYSDGLTESPGERRGRGAADGVKERLRASQRPLLCFLTFSDKLVDFCINVRFYNDHVPHEHVWNNSNS